MRDDLPDDARPNVTLVSTTYHCGCIVQGAELVPERCADHDEPVRTERNYWDGSWVVPAFKEGEG